LAEKGFASVVDRDVVIHYYLLDLTVDFSQYSIYSRRGVFLISEDGSDGVFLFSKGGQSGQQVAVPQTAMNHSIGLYLRCK
jgi:hypothetical protein